jgi:hypothetical protein
MTKPEYVIAPEGCEDYLTPGKSYRVVDSRGGYFSIIDDDDDLLSSCLLTDCVHANGDWIIPGADDVAAPEVTIDAVSVADIEIQQDGDNLLINQGMQTVFVYGRNIPALISALQLMVKK